MNDVLDRMRDIVQVDIGNRGLRTDPLRNLITETAGDFRAACETLAAPQASGGAWPRRVCLGIVTGFFIPTADSPAGETDGPLGAVFLARALAPLGIRVAIASDGFCIAAIEAGLHACGLREQVAVVSLPCPAEAKDMTTDAYWRDLAELQPTHLLAIERVGPSHVRAEVPDADRDRCHTMHGRDITNDMSPAHRLFETIRGSGITTIGIGDGGNEIGMGKILWEVIDRNIPRGGLVACRTSTDHLIVAGVSNWGAYALAAGVYALRGVTPHARLFDADEERRILKVMVEHGPLVDGVLGIPSATVDGLSWEQYSAVLTKLRELIPPTQPTSGG